MSLKKTESMVQIDKEFRRLLRDMGIEQHRSIEIDEKLSTCKKMNLIAANQSIPEINKNMKLQIFKLRTVPTLTCLEIIKCYLELGKSEVCGYFVENGGLAALEGSFEKLYQEEKALFCDIIRVMASNYASVPVSGLIKKVYKKLGPEILEILDCCVENSATKFLFEDRYIEFVISEAISTPSNEKLVDFLTSLYKKSDSGEKMYLKYFLSKAEFFKHVENAKCLEQEVKKRLCCAPVLENMGAREKFQGILEAVDSQGLSQAVVLILENLLFRSGLSLEELKKKIPADLKNLEREKDGPVQKKETPSTQCRAKETEDKPLPSSVGEEPTEEAQPAKAEAPKEEVCKKKAEVHRPPPSRRGPPRKKATQGGAKKGRDDVSKFEYLYRPVRWTKVTPGNSVWRSVSTVGVEDIFGAEDLSAFKKSGELQKVQGRTFVQPIIDPRKDNAINIALGRVKHSNAELKELILGCRLSDENLTRQLINNFPTRDELEMLKKREQGFGRAETFFKECMDAVDRLHEALCISQFVSGLRAQGVSVNVKFLGSFYRRLMSSRAFVDLLRLLLFLGNVLNARSILGKADGFALSDLGVFARTRGTTSESVLDIALRKLERREELREDLKSVDFVAQISLEEMEREMGGLASACLGVRGSREETAQRAMEDYEALMDEYEAFKRLHRDFEVFLGVRADGDFYRSLSFLSAVLGRGA